MPPAQTLLISVKEARKLLGKEAQPLSDQQVEEYITLLSAIAKDFLLDLEPLGGDSVVLQ